jgi:hypothetical protein
MAPTVTELIRHMHFTHLAKRINRSHNLQMCALEVTKQSDVRFLKKRVTHVTHEINGTSFLAVTPSLKLQGQIG